MRRPAGGTPPRRPNVPVPSAADAPDRQPVPKRVFGTGGVGGAPGGAADPATPGLTGALAGRRILVVDDNPEAANGVRELLAVLGAHAQVLYDPRRAPGALRRSHFDAVVLDLGMPHLGGYALAERIRRQARFDGVRLVALTGWSDPEARARSQAAGFHRHLLKPVHVADLVEALS